MTRVNYNAYDIKIHSRSLQVFFALFFSFIVTRSAFTTACICIYSMRTTLPYSLCFLLKSSQAKIKVEKAKANQFSFRFPFYSCTDEISVCMEGQKQTHFYCNLRNNFTVLLQIFTQSLKEAPFPRLIGFSFYSSHTLVSGKLNVPSGLVPNNWPPLPSHTEIPWGAGVRT